jgi:hypothetical protein
MLKNVLCTCGRQRQAAPRAQVFWDIPGGRITRVALRPAPQAAPASVQGGETARSGRRLRRAGARLDSLPKQALA